YAAKIKPDTFAISDDPAAALIINQRPQMTQTPPQGCAWIIGNAPEHAAEPITAVRTRGDCQISKQSPRLLGRRQLYSGVATSYEEVTQNADMEQLFIFHDSFSFKKLALIS